MKQALATAQAPAAIGPYSQAVDCGSFLVTSGQVPFDPVTGEVVPGGIAEQARRSTSPASSPSTPPPGPSPRASQPRPHSPSRTSRPSLPSRA